MEIIKFLVIFDKVVVIYFDLGLMGKELGDRLRVIIVNEF